MIKIHLPKIFSKGGCDDCRLCGTLLPLPNVNKQGGRRPVGWRYDVAALTLYGGHTHLPDQHRARLAKSPTRGDGPTIARRLRLDSGRASLPQLASLRARSGHCYSEPPAGSHMHHLLQGAGPVRTSLLPKRVGLHVDHAPVGVQHAFMHHFRQGWMREDGVHQIFLGGL